jgi:hypothetical protein
MTGVEIVTLSAGFSSCSAAETLTLTRIGIGTGFAAPGTGWVSMTFALKLPYRYALEPPAGASGIGQVSRLALTTVQPLS